MTKLTIKDWALDDRPREKLIQRGRDALSTAELIAILIGSGTKDDSAVDIAKSILKSADNDLNKLGKLTVSQLIQFNGIGEARAVSIVAALELGRRRTPVAPDKPETIDTSEKAYAVLSPLFKDLDHEQFYVILLNKANKIIETYRVSQGGVSATVADSRLILKRAIERLASSMILAHNHPSDNLRPSKADIDLTKNLKEIGRLLEIALLDHLIVGDSGYYSFADDSRL